MDYYDVAQICLNGHVINPFAKGYPEDNKKFCDKCGAATIINCPNCKAEIQGAYHSEIFIDDSSGYTVPTFCSNCGKPYPWTEAKIQAAHELAKEQEISDDEKKILTESIDDIVKDTPRTVLATTRFKKILSKTGKEASDAFRKILVDIISETTRKMLGF